MFHNANISDDLLESVLVGSMLTVSARHSLLLRRNFDSSTLSGIQLGSGLESLVDRSTLRDDGDRVRISVRSWAAILGRHFEISLE